MPTNLTPSARRRIAADTSDARSTLYLERRTSWMYDALRADGHPAIHALPYARHIVKVYAFVADLPEPASDGTGEVWTFVQDGATFTVSAEMDDIGGPEDNGDCYSAEDIAAWKRDAWHYYSVSVDCTLGAYTGSDSLGGIDAGYYWERTSHLSTTEQLWSAILGNGMLDNARDAAIAAVTAKTTGVTR